MGIGLGLWVATGLMLGSMCSSSGGEDFMRGSCWWVHWLKAELPYSFSIHVWSFSLFSSVAGIGSLVGGSGGRERSGHLQGLPPVIVDGVGSELDS